MQLMRRPLVVRVHDPPGRVRRIGCPDHLVVSLGVLPPVVVALVSTDPCIRLGVERHAASAEAASDTLRLLVMLVPRFTSPSELRVIG